MVFVAGVATTGPVGALALVQSAGLMSEAAAIVAGAVTGASTAATGLAATTGAASAVTGAVFTGSATLAEIAMAGIGGTLASGAAQGAVTAAVISGPLGWVALGADTLTWDCWKPVLMDDSASPSQGITLRDFYNHPNLRWMSIDRDGFLAENVRGQIFRLSPVDVDGNLAFHATSI